MQVTIYRDLGDSWPHEPRCMSPTVEGLVIPWWQDTCPSLARVGRLNAQGIFASVCRIGCTCLQIMKPRYCSHVTRFHSKKRGRRRTLQLDILNPMNPSHRITQRELGSPGFAVGIHGRIWFSRVPKSPNYMSVHLNQPDLSIYIHILQCSVGKSHKKPCHYPGRLEPCNFHA
jgi:hypothetical protein